MEEICGIYLITNKINGKSYIGQSINIKERFKQHKSSNKGDMYISRAIHKYGADNFNFSVLEECERDLLNERECFWIEEIVSISPSGYNLTSGGGAGMVFSDETKKKMLEAMAGEKHPLFGLKHSDETKKKISDSRIGRFEKENNPFYGKKHTEETKRKIGVANGGENSYWYGKTHTEETKEKLSKIKKGKVKSEEHKKKLAIASTGVVRPEESKIKQARTRMDGKMVWCSNGKIYQSIYEAAIDTNSRRDAVCNVCKGASKTTNNLSFGYNK